MPTKTTIHKNNGKFTLSLATAVQHLPQIFAKLG